MRPSRKITVAMSGGVDSSVAAALLVAEGHDVTGVFMKNWSDEADACTGQCGWQTEREDALRVSAVLGIPFETYDFEEEYRARVVEYMVAEYAAGRTPNPDVMCNSRVKFDLFLKRALASGAEMIATGHYAQVAHGTDGAPHELRVAADDNKDQSYFLHRLTQEQLAHTLFPIGHLKKPDVRRIAAERGLPVAAKKDSQGICFIGQVDLREFLGAKITGTPGPILTTDGVEVGRHEGVVPYTIGQRHGIRIGGGAAYFVVEKDIARNALIVAHETDTEALHAPALIATDAHWIAGTPPALPLHCRARIRYRQPLQDCAVSFDSGTVPLGLRPRGQSPGLRVDFATPQRAIAPGQFVVFHDGDRVIGGAVIARAQR